MPRLTGALVLTVALATVAACGDDSTSNDSVAATTTIAAPTPTDAVADTLTDDTLTDDTASDDTASDETVDSADAPGAGTEFCTINQTLDDAASAAIDEDGTPATLQEFFEIEFPAQFADMSAAAPADLADDMAVLGEGFTSLGELFAANEWDLEAAFSDPALTDVLDNQAYIDAGTAVDDYCGA